MDGQSSRWKRCVPSVLHNAPSPSSRLLLAKVRPLFDKVVMPRAEVVLRLRYEPIDGASEADLAYATDEFVQGRSVLFAVVNGLNPSIHRFSNFLRERYFGVSGASGALSVDWEGC